MEDFDERCAYSQQHVSRAGGESNMEVEHFNPSKKKAFIQKYSEFNLASSHCNGKKGMSWPKAGSGVRFLNPSFEEDYGIHIFEDPRTHRIEGITPEGKYHALKCGLNAPHLIKERAERTEIAEILNSPGQMKSGKWEETRAVIGALRQQFQYMIPPLPLLPRNGS